MIAPAPHTATKRWAPSAALWLCAALLGTSAAAQTIREIPIAANDVAYDASRGDLWVSVPSSNGGGNEVVPVDLQTGAIGPGIPVSQEPGRIEISRDFAWLYVSHYRSGDIHRIDLATRRIAKTFQLGTSAASDLSVHPTQPLVLAVARSFWEFSPSHAGVVITDDGVARPATTQSHTGSYYIEFDATGDQLFGYDAISSAFGFRRVRVDASGATEIAVLPYLFSGFGQNFRRVEGQLVHASGRSVDAATLLPNGVYANSGGSSPILVDVANDATYFVDLYSLRVYDRDRFTLRRTVALPYPVYGARSGAVWGVGRVVFTTQMNTLMVVDLGVDLADTDADGIVDAADNCPAASNKPQLDTDGDGAGDACDAQPLVPSGSPIACGAETLRANVAIAASSADIAQCVAAGFPDGDADGEPDATDRCAGTPEGASRDAAGCSQAQFCTAAGLARCTRGDFRNDEPASKKPADCAVAAGSCAAR